MTPAATRRSSWAGAVQLLRHGARREHACLHGHTAVGREAAPRSEAHARKRRYRRPVAQPGLVRTISAAVPIAKGGRGRNAGTCEFLVDDDGETFGFIEMNARLQVEHPVTEMVTGLDLVELQLRVAMGEALPLTQADITPSGHAIEVRLYAEDPDAGFLPQSGRLLHLRWPDEARVDSGVDEGAEVTTHYDPMLAKVIVHADDRPAALDCLSAALAETEVLGLRTNLPFLRMLADDETVARRAGDHHVAGVGLRRLDLGRRRPPGTALGAAEAVRSWPAATPSRRTRVRGRGPAGPVARPLVRRRAVAPPRAGPDPRRRPGRPDRPRPPRRGAANSSSTSGERAPSGSATTRPRPGRPRARARRRHPRLVRRRSAGRRRRHPGPRPCLLGRPALRAAPRHQAPPGRRRGRPGAARRPHAGHGHRREGRRRRHRRAGPGPGGGRSHEDGAGGEGPRRRRRLRRALATSARP